MESIWVALGGNAAFLIVLAFLGKKLLALWLDKDLEAFKQRITQAGAREMEVLRGQLQVAANEHAILLTRLQEKRAMIIGELYSQIARGVSELESYVRPLQLIGEESRETKAGKTRAALVAAHEYFNQQQIWLTQECAEKVSELMELLRTTFNNYDMARQAAARGHDGEGEDREVTVWMKAWDRVTGEVASTRRTLECEMRKLLEPPRPLRSGQSVECSEQKAQLA